MSNRRPMAVLGAINVDLVVSGAPLPTPGQTVVGGTFEEHQGGKGGNQAVAAVRMLGGHVVMLGAVGDDAMGAAARNALEAQGLDVGRLRTIPGVPTGVALIVVDDRGENQISVAPGANAHVEAMAEALEAERPSLLLASCEVPFAALREAAAWCRATGTTFVVNPAPASAEMAYLLDDADVITPNRGELAALAPSDPEMAARTLVSSHPRLSVVVTLGAGGATVVSAGGTTRVAAPALDVVDTTGAGDCFNGVLAAALWEGRPVRDAARRAVVAASLSTRVGGAREGMPTAVELDAALA